MRPIRDESALRVVISNSRERLHAGWKSNAVSRVGWGTNEFRYLLREPVHHPVVRTFFRRSAWNECVSDPYYLLVVWRKRSR